MELTEYNLGILRSKLSGKERLQAVQGNAMDLSIYEDNLFDMTLVLGPLYHIGSKPEKKRILEEAVRVTKPGGVIMAAYCMNEAVVIQEGFVRGNLVDGSLDDKFHCIYKAEELFSVVRLEEIYELTEGLSITREKIIATDGATNHCLDIMQKNI